MARKKRFGDGGDVEEMKRGIASNFKAEAPSESYAEEKTLGPSSFKEAFAEARAAGDKTFRYNGKKYTTDIKSAKPTASASTSEKESKSSEPESKPASKPASKPESKSNRGIAAGLFGAGAGMGAAALIGGIKKSEAARRERELAKGREERSTKSPIRNITPEEAAFENEGGRYYRKGGKVKKYASGGSASSASKRADGIAQRGKTKGKMY